MYAYIVHMKLEIFRDTNRSLYLSLHSWIAFKWEAIKSYHRRYAIFVQSIDMHRDVNSTVR